MINDEQKDQIVNRILDLTIASIKQLNRNAIFRGPISDDWYLLSILNSAHIVELALKATIASYHPLLIFEKLPNPPVDGSSLTLRELMDKGKTYDLTKLPQLFWAVTGKSVPNMELFKKAVDARNTVQHFLSPSDDLSELALRFTYEIADPILVENFGIYPVECSSNPDDYEYVVETLVRLEINFSKTQDFYTSGMEVYLEEALKESSEEYKKIFHAR